MGCLAEVAIFDIEYSKPGDGRKIGGAQLMGLAKMMEGLSFVLIRRVYGSQFAVDSGVSWLAC